MRLMRRPSSAGGKPDDRQRRARHADPMALERGAVARVQRSPTVTVVAIDSLDELCAG